MIESSKERNIKEWTKEQVNMEEKEIKKIDFIKIAKVLWPQKKRIGTVMAVVLFGTYLITVCIPRYYTCSVTLAPESETGSMPSSLGSLASSFGLGKSMSAMSQDAIYADIYPDVLGSKNFIAELMTTQITTKDGEIKCNYYTYLRDKQKLAWWSWCITQIVNWIKPNKPDTYTGEEKLSVFNLTKLQDGIFELARANIKGSVDKKTGMIGITVKDQDPKVCALMADSTCKKLQQFIITYRTNKARVDYDYYKKLCAESKADYEKARRHYTAYADAHQDVYQPSFKAKEEDLENEMQLKYNIYSTMSNQMHNAVAKLQQATPAFTMVETASMPIKPAGPKRMIISILMSILSFFAVSGWILIKSKN